MTVSEYARTYGLKEHKVALACLSGRLAYKYTAAGIDIPDGAKIVEAKKGRPRLDYCPMCGTKRN